MKKLILLSNLVLVFISCSSNDSTNTVPTPISITDNIYISGFERNNNNAYIAKYWKNGDSFNLTNATGVISSANSIFEENNNLYVAGCSFSSSVTEPVYWKNNTRYLLPYPSVGGEADKILISGNDVYISGKTNIKWGKYNAVYWKNGILTELTNWTNGTHDVNTVGIAVSGNDVYVAGNETFNYSSTAKYWKNGIVHNLSYGTSLVTATGIALMGNDVYVSGFANVGGITTALYWKNDIPINLSDGTHEATTNDILIKENDVYIVGSESNGTTNVAKYWKNNVSVNLANGTTSTSTCSISISGNDIYVLGNEYIANNTHLLYWKNGMTYNINTNNVVTPKSIFVKEN